MPSAWTLTMMNDIGAISSNFSGNLVIVNHNLLLLWNGISRLFPINLIYITEAHAVNCATSATYLTVSSIDCFRSLQRIQHRFALLAQSEVENLLGLFQLIPFNSSPSMDKKLHAW